MSDTSTTDHRWESVGKPEAPGWYSVLLCYDVQEGFFPGAAHWDGRRWDRSAVVSFGSLCATEDEAKKLAERNDPGW